MDGSALLKAKIIACKVILEDSLLISIILEELSEMRESDDKDLGYSLGHLQVVKNLIGEEAKLSYDNLSNKIDSYTIVLPDSQFHVGKDKLIYIFEIAN